MLSKEGSLKQNLASFFKRAFPQGSTVNSVNSMSSNRRENSSVGHHINQCAQVSVININIIWPKNNSELSDQTVSGCFNSKDLKDLRNIVAGGAFIINTFKSHDVSQVDAVCFDKPVVFVFTESSSVFVIMESLGFVRTLSKWNFWNCFETS